MNTAVRHRVNLPKPWGGHVDFYCDPATARLVLIVGRDDFFADDVLVDNMIEALMARGTNVARYVSRHEETRRLTAPKPLRRWPRVFRYPVIGILLVLHPSRWDYFRPGVRRRGSSIELRAAALRAAIRRLAKYEVFLLARSAGARLATMIADEAEVHGVVALGYPFQHPQEGPNRDRIEHLKTLQTPTLVVQGHADVYGGAEIESRYALSPAIKVVMVRGDHDFRLEMFEWASIYALLTHFFSGGASLGETQEPPDACPNRPVCED